MENENNNKSTMFKVRNVGVIVCSLALVIMIITSIFSGNKKDVSKLDLDNFSLETVTIEEQLKVPSSYRGFFEHVRSSGESSGIRSVYYKDYDKDKTYFSCKKITGINTVNATDAEDCTVEWKIDFNVSKGDAKAIIVMDENEIIKEFDPGENIVFSHEVIGEHNFYVKILCEKAKVQIEVERTIHNAE